MRPREAFQVNTTFLRHIGHPAHRACLFLHSEPNRQPPIISSRTPDEASGLGQRRQICYVLSAPFSQNACRFGETISHVTRQFPSPVCVCKVSQVGAEQASIELQVVILEWLGTADKLAVNAVDRSLTRFAVRVDSATRFPSSSW